MKMLKTIVFALLALGAAHVAFADHHGEAKKAYAQAVASFESLTDQGGHPWTTTAALVKKGAKALEADKLDDVMTISARIEAEVAATLEQARLSKQFWIMAVPR